MSVALEHLWETPVIDEQSCVEVSGELESPERIPRPASMGDYQLQSLIQQLFFRHEARPIRHVGLVAPDMETDPSALCRDIADALARDSEFKIGVIDASPGQEELPISVDRIAANRDCCGWKLSPHEWAVPLQNWLYRNGSSGISDCDLDRLRRAISEFDFSLLRCAPAMWSLARIGRACDGLVLVLTANKTRRIVAARFCEELRRAGLSVLGSVLAGRRFPLPSALYRKL